jgi:predicted transcriptional regulator
MSKKEFKRNILPKLQRKIVLKLAEKGALNVRETNKELRGEYTSTNRAFHELERKGIIKKVGVKEWRGRFFPTYWLTEEGRLIALLCGADIKKVKETALKFCKPEDKEDLMVTYEIIESVGPETASVILRALKGKTELAYLPLDENEAKKIFSILRKYPKWWAHVEKILRGVENE